MPTISSSSLSQFATDLFAAAGVPVVESRVVAASLVRSNLEGHDSHGVIRIPGYLKRVRQGLVVPGAPLQVHSETASALVTDGGGGFGQVQMAALIDRLRPKALAEGVACGTMKNSGHIGRLGEWVERTARDGLAGLVAANDNGALKCVAPPGGTAPVISTNPVAIGVPTGGEPLVVDVSTSVVANGKVHVAHVSGQECPPGWLLDSSGAPTTDPSVRFSDPPGTILPLGGEDHGYKGFGLGLLFDILVGGLTGGWCPPAPEGAADSNNVLLLLWDPERFSGHSHLVAEADKLIGLARDVPRKEGVASIRLPGDRARSSFRERSAHGIPLDEGTWRSLAGIADTLDVPLPRVA